MGRWDLKVNWKKTKVMKVARKRGGCEIKIGDQDIGQMEEMKYFGGDDWYIHGNMVAKLASA